MSPHSGALGSHGKGSLHAIRPSLLRAGLHQHGDGFRHLLLASASYQEAESATPAEDHSRVYLVFRSFVSFFFSASIATKDDLDPLTSPPNQ